MAGVRAAAVAGQFYPGQAGRLRASVQAYLRDAPHPSAPAPKALIAPHAGYVYSGPIAGSAYARIEPMRDQIDRVVLIGPAHRVFVRGLATPAALSFQTPLGEIPVDVESTRRILALPQVVTSAEAHAFEHSLEVHLPFLQEVLDDFALVPLVVGDATASQVAEVIETLWGDDETLIVVSSDLSHYHDYDAAKRIDAATSRAIEALEPDGIGPDEACGCMGIRGLLLAARRRGLHAEAIDVRNSGDTAGPRDRVVGYGSYVVS